MAKKPQDATLRNVRAADRRLDELERKITFVLKEYAELRDEVEILKDDIAKCARKRRYQGVVTGPVLE
jgi:predicted  nucleic acid-binding Zn-ribbon protein